MMSKFHDDPMVDESGIVVLLGQILGLYEKRESYDVKDISLTSDTVTQSPMVRTFENEFQTWCSNFMKIQWLTASPES